MKQLIKDVLEDMSTGQINLESEASRELIANTIIANIKTNNGRKGWFLDLSTLDGGPKLDTPIYEKSDEQKARETWVCSICGKSTYEVDYDYIGSGTNHLGCELRLEQDENYRKKNWSQKKHEDKVFGDDLIIDMANESDEIKRGPDRRSKDRREIVQTLDDGGGITYRDSKTWVDRLAEEIVTDNDTNYIYESPDRGETVYKRKIGSDERELVKDWEKIKNNE